MNLILLGKVWALRTSPVAGEAQAAMHRAQLMVEAVGKTLDDVPELLGAELGPRGACFRLARRPAWYSAAHEASMGCWADRQQRWNDGIGRFGGVDVRSAAETARTVRAMLKLAFPGIKFRVLTGKAFTVEWVAGPSEATVSACLSRYAPGRAWVRHWTITRADVGGLDARDRAWANPPPRPNDHARLVWFNHLGIACIRSPSDSTPPTP